MKKILARRWWCDLIDPVGSNRAINHCQSSLFYDRLYRGMPSIFQKIQAVKGSITSPLSEQKLYSNAEYKKLDDPFGQTFLLSKPDKCKMSNLGML